MAVLAHCSQMPEPKPQVAGALGVGEAVGASVGIVRIGVLALVTVAVAVFPISSAESEQAAATNRSAIPDAIQTLTGL